MADDTTEMKARKWFTEEVKFLVLLGSLLVAVVASWSTMDKRLALTSQRLDNIENNQLVSIQEDIDIITSELTLLTEAIIRIEQSLNTDAWRTQPRQ